MLPLNKSKAARAADGQLNDDHHGVVAAHAHSRAPVLVLAALAALARTCRAFQELALDRLWRDIPDLTILPLYLLPSKAVEIRNTDEGQVVVSVLCGGICLFDSERNVLRSRC